MSQTLLRSGAAILATASVAALAPSAGAANSGTDTRFIIGGSSATNPAVVQLAFTQGSGRYGCTGEVIAGQWILTARHCTSGSTKMDVYFSNSTTAPGTPVRADRVLNSPYGDVGLIHIPTAAKTSGRMTLASSYTPVAGASGTIMGYGLRAAQAQPDHLYSASVSVLGKSTDAFGGNAIHVRGVSGASNHGDSGGPLIIGGQVVGVCSTGDSADPGSNTHASSNYANLTAHRAWIRSNAGV